VRWDGLAAEDGDCVLIGRRDWSTDTYTIGVYRIERVPPLTP
jgi:hypothetical protein